jgi:hypothetical protein
MEKEVKIGLGICLSLVFLGTILFIVSCCMEDSDQGSVYIVGRCSGRWDNSECDFRTREQLELWHGVIYLPEGCCPKCLKGMHWYPENTVIPAP